MENINISLSESSKDFAAEQVSEGSYSSLSDYINALIRADQKQKAKAAIEAEVLKGLDSGPMVTVTREDWEDIRREVRERFEARNRS